MLHTLALVACLLSPDATAESTVKGFVQAFNSQDWKGVFSRIDDAKVDEVVPGFAKLMTPPSSVPKLALKSIEITETGEVASGPVSLSAQVGTLAPVSKQDQIHLHKIDGDWKIVDGQDPKGIFHELCVIARNPSKMPKPGVNQKTVILSNMKIIGLAVLMYLNDWDDKLTFDQSSMKTKLEPYLATHNGKYHPWNAMDGTLLDVRINPALVGKLVTKVADPTHCVLLTIGPKANLQYFYGETPIVFVDGHAKFLNKEAVAALKWK